MNILTINARVAAALAVVAAGFPGIHIQGFAVRTNNPGTFHIILTDLNGSAHFTTSEAGWFTARSHEVLATTIAETLFTQLQREQQHIAENHTRIFGGPR